LLPSPLPALHLSDLIPTTSPDQPPENPPPKRPEHHNENNTERGGPADLPEVGLGAFCLENALQVHAEVRREEGQGQKDDGDGREDEDGFVLAVGLDGEFVLFY
jgi:hypothetical protein